jgi:hypothetical protein
MTAPITVLDPLPVEVPRPLVLLRLGYRRPEQVPARTGALIDAVLAHGAGRLAPKAVCGEFEVVAAPPDRVEFGGVLRAASRSLCERLLGCRRAVLFAATIGPAAETWIHDLADRGEMTNSLLADAYASAAAIALGTAIEKVVLGRLRDAGLEATKRYAPGYGDWDLADQTPLCSLIEVARIGITVTADHLMIPAKSLSGVIGGHDNSADRARS